VSEQTSFCASFKQAVGQPPHRYVSAKRLERAKASLIGDRPLVDIALALGFSDQASFTRSIQAGDGSGAGQYRLRLGSRESESSLTDFRHGLPAFA